MGIYSKKGVGRVTKEARKVATITTRGDRRGYS
jgi:hypothetical protein